MPAATLSPCTKVQTINPPEPFLHSEEDSEDNPESLLDSPDKVNTGWFTKQYFTA